MKRLIAILSITLVVGTASAAIQNDPGDALRERVYLQSDKDIYLAGELAWLKMVTTTDTGVPLNFSKVGYVEILNGSEAKARGLLHIEDCTGNGSLMIPADLPTGTYRLVGYTRYMGNESPEVFFEKVIGVVNPVVSEAPLPDNSAPGIFPADGASAAGGSGITLSIDKSLFDRRSPVDITLNGIPDNIHTLSVSVAGKNPMNSFPEPFLPLWKSSIPSPHALSDIEFAEYEGHSIRGRLTNAYSGEPASSELVVPLVSFQGDEINFFAGHLDDDGTVRFQTKRANGYNEIVTSITGIGPEGYQLNIESPYYSGHPNRPLPLLDVESIDNDLLLDQTIGLQVRYAYVSDSLAMFDFPSPDFYHSPDYSYLMEDYRKFGTMGEVITEYVTFVQFRNVDGKRRLGVVRYEYGLKLNSLVMLDGIPVFDHEIIFKYNPLLLKRIDVYLEQFVFGGLKYDGMVAFYTDENKAPELIPDPYTRIQPYEMPQAPRLFYSPDYSLEETKLSHLPDFRHTLYWNPEVKTEGGQSVSVPFYTSDQAGDYRVTVEGITEDGKVVWATTDFTVR